MWILQISSLLITLQMLAMWLDHVYSLKMLDQCVSKLLPEEKAIVLERVATLVPLRPV
jgi:hypothetical protein